MLAPVAAPHPCAASDSHPAACLPPLPSCLRACSWLLYNVASHPEVQARCTAALARAGLLHVEGGAPARELTWEDVNGIPYLQAVIKVSRPARHICARTCVVRVWRRRNGPPPTRCLTARPCGLALTSTRCDARAWGNGAVQESLRHTTTGATGTFRQAHRDMVLGGKWRVPKGAVLWVPFACVHSTPHNFLVRRHSALLTRPRSCLDSHGCGETVL